MSQVSLTISIVQYSNSLGTAKRNSSICV